MDYNPSSSFNHKEFPYAVVEYTSFDESLVEAVPSTWLYDGAYRIVDGKKILFAKSYWPNQVSKVETFIKNNRNPGGALGIVDNDLRSKNHAVRVFKFCKSYQIACLKRNKALYTDNLDTTDAEKSGRSQRTRRRKISESDDDDAPKLKTLKIQSGNDGVNGKRNRRNARRQIESDDESDHASVDKLSEVRTSNVNKSQSQTPEKQQASSNHDHCSLDSSKSESLPRSNFQDHSFLIDDSHNSDDCEFANTSEVINKSVRSPSNSPSKNTVQDIAEIFPDYSPRSPLRSSVQSSRVKSSSIKGSHDSVCHGSSVEQRKLITDTRSSTKISSQRLSNEGVERPERDLRKSPLIQQTNMKYPEKRNKVSSTPTQQGHKATQRTLPSKSPRRNLFSPKKSPFKPASGRYISLLPIMREISDIKSMLNKVILVLNKVWTVVAPPIEGPASSDFPRLPIDSKEDLKKWHEFLSDDRNFYSAVNVLSSHGRSDHRESVYAILRALLTDKLAVGFNLDGRKKKDDPSPKEAFGETLSYKLLKVAMKKHINHFNKGIDPQKVSLVYNVKNIKEDTMRWLKDAKTRASNKEKREKAAKAKVAEEAAGQEDFSDNNLFDDESN